MNYDFITRLLGSDADRILSLFGGVTFVMSLLIIGRSMMQRVPTMRRLNALAKRRVTLRAEFEAASVKRRAIPRITQNSQTALQVQSIMARLRMLQQEQLEAAENKLLHAGIRRKDMAVAAILGRAVLPIIFLAIALFLIHGIELWPDLSDTKKSLAIGGSLLLGYKAPDLFIKNLITKRVEAIRKGLPDALDLLIICAEAGLTVDAAFSRVSRELGRAYPELADEFWLTSIELGFLTDRRIAFQNLARRSPLESIQSVVTTLIQTEKYGTPVAAALRVLTAEFRNERMMRAETKAARLPALMTVPMIVFTLPPLFVVIIGPGVVKIADGLLSMA